MDRDYLLLMPNLRVVRQNTKQSLVFYSCRAPSKLAELKRKYLISWIIRKKSLHSLKKKKKITPLKSRPNCLKCTNIVSNHKLRLTKCFLITVSGNLPELCSIAI